MSWKGTGRSGIGEQTILGDYDDWDGLSMNGRQWKSRLTKETRDLSGADYWHQRKALEPKMPEDIPTFVNGRPNISAFAEPEQKPVAKKRKSVADSIDLSNRHLERMEKLSEQLDEEFLAGEIDEERYELLRYKMDERLIKAFRRVEKENAPIWEMEDAKFNASKQPVECEWKESNTLAWGSKENDSKGLKSPLKQGIDNGFELDFSLIKKDSFFSSISDDNFFKKLFVMGLTVAKKVSKIGNVMKQIIQDGLI